ncbi:unnamed protein product, partial [Candidula unifasciata]
SLPETYVEGFHDITQVKLMPYRPLGRTGLHVSALSFGASSLGSVFRSTEQGESLEVVKTALKSGINYLDTAPWYGHGKSESVLGKAEVRLESVQSSSLRIKYILTLTIKTHEILQICIHDMEFAPSIDIILNETLPALQKVKEAGKAKFIGITGYPLENFKTVLEKSQVQIDVILTYCRASMNDNSLRDWLPYFQSQGVGVVNASPISMGLLSSRGPPAWHPASSVIKTACAEAAAYCSERGVDISRLALKFTLDQTDIPTTLVSTASLENLQKNIESVHTPLSDKEKQVLEEVMEKFLNPLQNANWEGVEVAEYRRSLEQQCENLVN